MSEQPVGDEIGDVVGVGDVLDVRDVEAHRLEIIDAVSGGRFHHAMSDQRYRAHAFERLLRWQRMRHELMEPGLLGVLDQLAETSDLEIDLRAVNASAELPARRRPAAR